MRTKHTPGPWIQVGHWVEHPNEAVADICTCDPDAIGQGHLQRKDSEIVANARLIAAAPEMLEALQAIYHERPRGYQYVSEYSLTIEDIARKAIAKATGAGE